MKRYLIFITAFLAFLLVLFSCSESDEVKESVSYFYVSADADGVNANGTKEQPFKTLTAARDAVRKVKKESGLPDGGITILVLDGNYSFSEPLNLTSDDSGEQGKRIVYKSEGNVVFDGTKITNIICGEDVSYVSFEGIVFENAKENAVAISGVSDAVNSICIKNCVFKNIGNTGISLLDVVNSTVEGNELYSIGGTGIEVTNAAFADRSPSKNIVKNNLVNGWSKVSEEKVPAILAEGMGFHISNNELYDGESVAILFWCGDSIVEYNIIHDVININNDYGAITNGGSWARSGNVVRYNYIYNLNKSTAEKKYMGDGIYFRTMIPGQYVYGNILVYCAVVVAGGKDITIKNNVFVDPWECPLGITDMGITEAGYEKNKYNGRYENYWDDLNAMDYTNEFISAMCPELLLMAEVGYRPQNADDPGSLAYHVVENNIVYNLTKGHDVFEFDQLNVIPHHMYSLDGSLWTGGQTYLNGSIRNNPIYKTDPGFVSIGKVEHALREDSQVYRDLYNFEPIPYDMIGITE